VIFYVIIFEPLFSDTLYFIGVVYDDFM